VPVRAEAREGAEQETQMLFGELCTLMSREPSDESLPPKWYHVRLETDSQEGWVDAKMITPMTQDEYTAYSATLKDAAIVAFPMAYAMSENNGQTIPLTAGTLLANYELQITNYEGHEARFGRFEVLGVGFRIDPNMVITAPYEMSEQNLLQVTRFFLNVPYLWGGKNALGMDCSGFSQVILSLFGKKLLRNASEQATQGRKITALRKAQAGDLVFFEKPHPASPEGKETTPHITHVGILIDSERVIHCSGRVKVEKIDETGIYNIEQGGYSHHLVAIRRI
jgi:cell wall-associated NlpC family hydrolase